MADRREVMLALDRHVEKTVVRLAVNAVANLTEVTPFDTGWARANWIPTLGQPATGTGGEAAKQAGLVAVLAFRLGSGLVFVSNRVPYIRRLDGGSSTQAPAGFVQFAINRALSEAHLAAAGDA